MSHLRFLLLIALSVLGQRVFAAPLIYSVRDLGALPGGTSGAGPADINDVGQVVGSSHNGQTLRAFLWQDGSMTEIAGDGEYTSVYAWGINNRGQVAGSRQIGSGPTSAFLWQDGVTLDLGRLAGADDAGAGGVNDAGVVTGTSGGRPFLWDSGVMRDFTAFAGANEFGNAIINNRGAITGTIAPATTGPIFRHAALWIDGQSTDLGDLPGGSYNLFQDGNYSAASAINDVGQVVGRSDGANGYHAVLWSEGAMIDLGALRGLANRSGAEDINNHGIVVGYSGEHDTHAFVWDSISGMNDLNDLLDESGSGWLLTTANAINNHGQIVGGGYLDGHLRGFLLTPIPEPATLLSAAVALTCATIIAARHLFRKGGKLPQYLPMRFCQ